MAMIITKGNNIQLSANGGNITIFSSDGANVAGRNINNDGISSPYTHMFADEVVTLYDGSVLRRLRYDLILDKT